jgi:Na+/serine symporter
MRRADLAWPALAAGAVLLAVGLPVRALFVTLHRKLALGEPFRHALRIALALSPTLVFTLVLAQILREQFHVPGALHSGLVLYALVTTLLPGFLFRIPSPDFTAPRILEDEPAAPAASS